jgi:GTP-binding protein LepA
MAVYEIPLATIITDFFDKLKSITSGYSSMNYEVI